MGNKLTNKSLKFLLTLILLISTKYLFAKNLHENQNIHEDIVAAQELITLGCMGKLSVNLNPSGIYDSKTLQKIQLCADNEGSDIAAKAIKEYKSGETSKERSTVHLLHYAIIFAKINNSKIENISTENLIKMAREQGKKHYPYIKDSH